MSLETLRKNSKNFSLTEEHLEEREAGRLSFISEFPLSTIIDLNIDQYVAGTDRNSFCYWLEFKKIHLGIGGGNASKFGVYKAKDGSYRTGTASQNRELSGAELDEHFLNIKTGIIKALEYVENNEPEKIRTIAIPVWNMVLQKILCLYHPEKFLAIGAADVIIECAKDIELSGLDLSPENSIQINYECNKLLRARPEYKDWSWDELGAYIWSAYKDEPHRNYYIIGSKYGEHSREDIFPKLISDGVVSVGFAWNHNLEDFYLKKHSEIKEYLKELNEASNSYSALKHFLSLKVGDRIAIKRDGAPRGNKAHLLIGAIAEVVEKEGSVYNHDPDGLGHLIHVKFLKAPVNRVFEMGYGHTIHKLSNQEHIDLIFRSDYEIVALEALVKDYRIEYTKWLNAKYGETSGTVRSYLKAMDLLTESLSMDLFKTKDEKYLKDLHKDLLKNQEYESSKYYNPDFPSYGKNRFYSSSIGAYIKFHSSARTLQGKNKSQMNFNLNTILYGPPGTGKTYNTILRAAQIMEGREIDSYEEAQAIFKHHLHNRIEFITFHQNYSYEDFIQGLRPETDNESSLTFDKVDGVFKRIADRALENYRLSEKGTTDLSKEVQFSTALEEFQDIVLESEENYALNDAVYIFNVEHDAFRYTGANWIRHAKGLRMKFSDLREFFRNEVKSRKDIKKLKSVSSLAKEHATYYLLAYNLILEQLPTSLENPDKVEKQNYVIIIDEINRANISRVFGELITLIEPDKRSNGAIPLEARLPSGDSFIVPSNLYIIGTMNTADKSIALLDIALRRRFEFEAMYPDYNIDGTKDVDILEKLNKEIIDSKGHDFQIGHSFFMGKDYNLIDCMNKKVIPLLLEYFMNDKDEVIKILKSASLEVIADSWPIKISGKSV